MSLILSLILSSFQFLWKVSKSMKLEFIYNVLKVDFIILSANRSIYMIMYQLYEQYEI